MLGPSSPADAVVGVEVDTGLSLLLVDKLEAVVVDEDVGATALELVGRNGLLNRLDRGRDNRVKTFLVDGALDGDVGELAACYAAGLQCRVETTVLVDLLDWANDLSDTSDDDLTEKLLFDG